MDEVFKALADPTRRSLLDELFEQDGQTPERARAAVADDALRRDEAPEGARGGRARGHQAAWPREAPLPEPRPDPARPRPLGEQIRRALGRDAQRAQAQIGGQDDGEGVRDLHQDDPGAPLGGDHRRRDEAASTTSASESHPTGRPARATRARTRPASTSPRARTSRSTRRAGSSRAWSPCGATT